MSLLLLLVQMIIMGTAVHASNQPPVVVSKILSSTTTATHKKKRLTLSTMSEQVKRMDYAVRGKVVVLADEIAKVLSTTKNKNSQQQQYPFDHIVYTNIGNPHSVGQLPLSWPRQVMALVDLPDELGVDHPYVREMFPEDAIRRARDLKVAMDGYGTGAYSHSKGVHSIRQNVARFIQQRDGGSYPSDPEHIFLTNGASSAIQMVLQTLIAKPHDGIMLPIPQYPIYSATVDLLNGHKVGYYLNEEQNWALDVVELERAYQDATAAGINVVGLVVINPGNPTGQCLTEQNLHQIVEFCVSHNLVLLADEVYQENVYDDQCQFVSCKKAAGDTGHLDEIELVSFHSVSKGVFGECGRRGGYMELVGIDEDVIDELYKLASANLCSTVSGQIMVDLMVQGPDVHDPSYELHESQKRQVWESLKTRSQIVSRGLNAIPGFSCQPAASSMYCFPRVRMPSGAIRAAQEAHISPDALYCVDLLRSTGICVVPASGFGQREGRYGFRTTFLPPVEEMRRCVQAIETHYTEFLQKYEP
jgi:aspartate/methionine/tyrosine aminotransferase